MNSNVFQKSPSIIRATEKQRKREREVVAAPEAPIVPPWQWLILWAWTLFWMPAWISLWPDMIINTLFSTQLLHRGHITIWWTPHSRDLSSIIDMMQRKTKPLRAQTPLEILLALPLVMGPPCLSWKSFGLNVGPSLLDVPPLCPTWWICSAFFPHRRLDASPSEAPLGKDLSPPGWQSPPRSSRHNH